VQEWYANREDKLQTRVHEGGLITENFAEGRPRSLKEHIYKANFPGPEADRTMLFYDKARLISRCYLCSRAPSVRHFHETTRFRKKVNDVIIDCSIVLS